MDVSPVYVKTRLELADWCRAHHLCGETVPVIDCPDREGVPANPRHCFWLGQFPLMASGAGIHRSSEEVRRIQVDASVDDLVDLNHIASATTVVE